MSYLFYTIMFLSVSNGNSFINRVHHHNKYSLAQNDSFGFFDDILNAAWRLKRCIHLKPHRGLMIPEEPSRWYQNNAEPSFTCHHEVSIGKLGDGHKWVCDPHRIAKQPSCIVLNVGSSAETSFEEAVLRDISPDCEIHTFDCTLSQNKIAQVNRNYQRISPNLHFHPWCLGPERKNGYKTLNSTLVDLSLVGRSIDIFKIDCEGCEWSTFQDWLTVDLRQILVELHNIKVPSLFNSLYKAGYVVFHKESNTLGCKGSCIEYSFLKLSPNFVRHKETLLVETNDPYKTKTKSCLMD